jgi:hypothetical protein
MRRLDTAIYGALLLLVGLVAIAVAQGEPTPAEGELLSRAETLDNRIT